MWARVVSRIFIYGSLVFSLTCGAVEAGSQASFAAITPAVAFVFVPSSGSAGTGIIVHTSNTGAYIITANHVIKNGTDIDVYFEGDSLHPHAASVVARDLSRDLILLHTSDPGPAQSAIADTPAVGEPIAVLGYPTSTAVKLLQKTGELKAEGNVGTVTSIYHDGDLLNTTAYAEEGDSGAPVFRQDNAEIVGIVTGHFGTSKVLGFQATGSTELRRFLTRANIPFFGRPAGNPSILALRSPVRPVIGLAPLRNAPGARRLVVYLRIESRVDQDQQRPDYTLNDTSALTKQLTLSMSSFVSKIFLSTSVIQESTETSPAELGRQALYGGFIGALDLDLKFHVRNSPLLSAFEAEANLRVIDSFGDVVFSGGSRKNVTLPLFEYSQPVLAQNVSKIVDDVTDRVSKQIADGGEDVAINFSRYGIPLNTGGRRAFFSLEPDPKGGAHVSSLFPYGTAARAQLQLDDRVVALDGMDLTHLSAVGLQTALANHEQPLYRLTLIGPDGQPLIVTFEAEDIRWYLEHPLRRQP